MITAILPTDPPFITIAPPQRETRAAAALLGAALVESQSQGAYLYRIEALPRLARLESAAGLPIGEGQSWILGRGVEKAAFVLERDAWLDDRFRGLGLFREHRFESVVSIPILAAGEAAAIFLICRLHRTPVKATEFAFLQSLAPSLLAVSVQDAEMDALRRRVEDLTTKLAARKLIERAKGILQEQLQLTEEEAYLSMRRLSRRRRIPMGAVAEALIDDARIQEIRS